MIHKGIKGEICVVILPVKPTCLEAYELMNWTSYLMPLLRRSRALVAELLSKSFDWQSQHPIPGIFPI